DSKLRSLWTTRFATFRWTKTSPGGRSTISFAGTRLSEQPIQRSSRACRSTSDVKKAGSRATAAAAQRRLPAKSSSRPLTLRRPFQGSAWSPRADSTDPFDGDAQHLARRRIVHRRKTDVRAKVGVGE